MLWLAALGCAAAPVNRTGDRGWLVWPTEDLATRLATKVNAVDGAAFYHRLADGTTQEVSKEQRTAIVQMIAGIMGDVRWRMLREFAGDAKPQNFQSIASAEKVDPLTGMSRPIDDAVLQLRSRDAGLEDRIREVAGALNETHDTKIHVEFEAAREKRTAASLVELESRRPAGDLEGVQPLWGATDDAAWLAQVRTTVLPATRHDWTRLLAATTAPTGSPVIERVALELVNAATQFASDKVAHPRAFAATATQEEHANLAALDEAAASGSLAAPSATSETATAPDTATTHVPEVETNPAPGSAVAALLEYGEELEAGTVAALLGFGEDFVQHLRRAAEAFHL